MTTLEKSNKLHLASASKFHSLQLNSFVNSAEWHYTVQSSNARKVELDS
jgi:hypothetical protein